MANLTPEQLYQLAMQAGFSAQDAVTQVAISLAENHGSDPAILSPPNKNGSTDAGLNQINSGWWAQFGGLANVLEPLQNFKAAKWIKDNTANGWGNWTTYTDQAYQSFLPRARAAAQAVLSGAGGQPLPVPDPAPTGAIPGTLQLAGTPIAAAAGAVGDVLAQAGQQGQQAVQGAANAQGVAGAVAAGATALGGLTTGVSGFLGLLARVLGTLADSHLWWRILLVAGALGLVLLGLILYVRPPVGQMVKTAAAAAVAA